jgi:REP element-mobilizing transposase RayT
MSRKYKAYSIENPFFITLTVIDWVDLFTKREYKDIICSTLNFLVDNRKVQIIGYVIMSNHIHVIIYSHEFPLYSLIKSFKRHTHHEFLKVIDSFKESRKHWLLPKFKFAAKGISSDYKIWQEGYHAIELYNETILEQKLEYIYQNPVRAGWVESPEEYFYSSARSDAHKYDPVKVTLI